MTFTLISRGLSRWLGILALCLAANSVMSAENEKKTETTEKATFGGGCFWCLEAFYETFDGVKSVVSGYAGGKTENPTYKQVCTGETGHAEVVQIEYDPKKISYEELLQIFWDIHDPTTLNRQGADRGTQYRSVIYYHNEEQKRAAEKSMKAAGGQFADPIVTELAPLPAFYVAEDYHQDYFRNNPNAPYCAAVIKPKLPKVQKLKKALGK